MSDVIIRHEIVLGAFEKVGGAMLLYVIMENGSENTMRDSRPEASTSPLLFGVQGCGV